jgi:hypothetical protein
MAGDQLHWPGTSVCACKAVRAACAQTPGPYNNSKHFTSEHGDAPPDPGGESDNNVGCRIRCTRRGTAGRRVYDTRGINSGTSILFDISLTFIPFIIHLPACSEHAGAFLGHASHTTLKLAPRPVSTAPSAVIVERTTPIAPAPPAVGHLKAAVAPSETAA